MGEKEKREAQAERQSDRVRVAREQRRKSEGIEEERPAKAAPKKAAPKKSPK